MIKFFQEKSHNIIHTKKINRMRLHELSRLLERDSQSVFSTKEKKGKKIKSK